MREQGFSYGRIAEQLTARGHALYENLTVPMKNDTNILAGTKKAAELLDISPRFFASMESAGEIGPMPIRLGSRKLYDVAELKQWAAARCPTRSVWQELKKNQLCACRVS